MRRFSLLALLAITLTLASCGSSDTSSTGGDRVHSVSMTLVFPEGYNYDRNSGTLHGPSGSTSQAAPSYVTSITLALTGNGASFVYNIPLSTGIVDLSVPPGDYLFSLVITTQSGVTFTGQTNVTMVSGDNPPVSITLAVNAPPVISSVIPASTSASAGDAIGITATASDPDGDPLTYSWSASGGSISGSGATVFWTIPTGSSGATVTVTVNDGNGGTATGSASIGISNSPPVMGTVSVSNNAPNMEVPITLTCSATDPDNDPLTYTWSGSDGFSATGASVTYTVGGSVTSVTFTCTATDSLGLSATGTVTINSSDTTPPATTVVWAESSTTATTWTGSATIDEAGTGYCVALTNGSPAPTVAEVIANNSPDQQSTGSSVTMTANTSGTCTVTGLTAATTYDFYFVAKDTAGNVQANVSEPVNATVGVPLAGLFTDANLQTCVNGLGLTFTHEVTTLSCVNKSIVLLDGIENLTNMTTLNLTTNQIVTLTPLAGLTGLTNLKLKANQIVSIASLVGLTNLTVLWLNQNQVVDISILSGMGSLQQLRLNANNITNFTPISGLTTLTGLFLSNSSITDLTPFAGLTNMITLELNNNSIVNVAPLAGMTAISNLRLDVNQIVDVSPLASLTTLNTALRLSVNPIGGQGVGKVNSLLTLTGVTNIYLGTASSLSCAEAHELICGVGNTVVAGACSPGATGLGTVVNLEGLINNIDTPTNGTNCTNP